MIAQSICTKNQIHHNCDDCSKKTELIDKYQKLIQLLKKKQMKTTLELSSKLSQVKTNSHTSLETSTNFNASKLFYALNSILMKKYSEFFCASNRKSAKKFMMLSLANRIKKESLAKGFCQIKRLADLKNLNKFREIDQSLRCGMLQAFSHLKKSARADSNQFKDFKTEKPIKQKVQEIKDHLQQLRSSVKDERTANSKWLSRQNIELQMKNIKLLKQNTQLKEMLEEAVRRQNKENMKKKESLEMLAQELFQKNDLISQLQTTIKTYENKYDLNSNVLDEDIVSLRNEVDHLEKIKDKLDHDLTKKTSKLEAIELKQKLLEEKVYKLEQQNSLLNEKVFGIEAKEYSLEKMNNSVKKLIQELNKRIKKLKVYENELLQIERGSKKSIHESSQNIGSEAKAEIILCFLENIHLSDYQLPSMDLFDEEQQYVLLHHQTLYQKYSNQNNNFSYAQNKKLESEEIQFKGSSESFLEAIESSKENKTDESERKSNINIKLLEMQLQKNKQIQKISQLKDKIMHIRVIILNLLKSLEIKNVSTQAHGILQILFDLFEYSQEEREEVFASKKKKFWGLI